MTEVKPPATGGPVYHVKKVNESKGGGKRPHQGHEVQRFWWCLVVTLHHGAPTVDAGGNPSPERKKTRGHQSPLGHHLHTGPTTKSEASVGFATEAAANA